jgi:phosphinothricin acetyltransferase
MNAPAVRRIEVVPHDPRWAELFRHEAASLRALMPAEIVAIHHIGSTAIPPIPAKPIVDLLVVVRDIERINDYDELMLQHGYLPRGELGIPGRRFFIKGDEVHRTHHLHMFQADHPRIEHHLAFRDYMLAHPEDADAYGRLKEESARRFPTDADGYMDGKEWYIHEIDRRAAAWRAGLAQAAAGVVIEPLTPADWERVRAIYREGIAGGQATFETEAPAWEAWDASHLPCGRLVARRGAEIVGWAALSAVSRRPCYAGVAEFSLYVAGAAQRQGIGRALLKTLIVEAERHGIWTLQGATFPENAGSLALQAECGFRVVGRRERIAQLAGRWRDTIIMERRSVSVGNA